MKKISYLLGIIVVAVFFSACNPVETVVTVTVKQDVTTAAPGDTVVFSVYLSPDHVNKGELGAFSISADSTEIFTKAFSGTAVDSLTYDYIVPADATVGKDIVLTFKAVDGKSNKENTTTASVTVKAGLPEILSASAIQSNYISTSLTNSMMFVLGADACTTADGNSTDGDLAFVWQNTYGYSVCSPNASWIHDLYTPNGINYTTADKKETKIQLYTGNWADLTQEAINNLTVTTSTVAGGGNGVQNLNEGDIVVFETADGRKGALLVKTNAKVTKNMTADFMYQKTAASAGTK